MVAYIILIHASSARVAFMPFNKFNTNAKFLTESEKKYSIDDFIDRIESYLRDDGLREYKRIVKSPICFGEIISKLIVCDYKDYSSLIGDVDFLVKNCATFWSVDRGTTAAFIFSVIVLNMYFWYFV